MERGRVRFVSGEQVQDRTIEHALCDEYLSKEMEKYLIYDNGASIKNKGIDFTRRRLDTHLHRYYTSHHGNSGFILLIDFSKYYDNIQHDKLRELIYKRVTDEKAIYVLEQLLKASEVDVSYMTDEEYANCMNVLFNSLDYSQIDKSLKTGEKFMKKHIDIGRQFSQVGGISYRTPIDNFVKIVQGQKFYGGYMDDTYVINESKEYLEWLLEEIIKIADEYGITVNRKKTRICRLSDSWRFLQTQYSLTETGRIIKKINPKQLTRMRRKMKKLACKMTMLDFYNWYHSWMKNYYKIMSKRQRGNLDELYNHLIKETKDYVYSDAKKRKFI